MPANYLEQLVAEGYEFPRLLRPSKRARRAVKQGRIRMGAGCGGVCPAAEAPCADRAVDGRDELGAARGAVSDEVPGWTAVHSRIVWGLGVALRHRADCGAGVWKWTTSADVGWRALDDGGR